MNQLKSINQNNQGIGLIEILVALTIFIIGVVTIALMYLGSLTSSVASLERSRAVVLAQEGLAAVQSIGYGNFTDLEAGSFELALSDNRWNLVSVGQGGNILEGFNRSIAIAEGGLGGWLITSEVTWDHIITGNEESVILIGHISDI